MDSGHLHARKLLIFILGRSPTHQIQIYNQYGQFVRKFGANILQHPRGVCVDNKGRIIVVECKVGWSDWLTEQKQIFTTMFHSNHFS